MSKYGRLRAILEARGLLDPTAALKPTPISVDRAAAVHERGYVARAFALALTEAEQKRIGLPRRADIVRRARLAAAGTLLAAETALEVGLACNTAGGSHHAGPEGGAGFSTLNDVAIAAADLLARGRVCRALVVDCDVHQGDGTARIFAGDDRVFTLSLHAAKNYPFEKARSDLDVPLPDGVEDAAYLAALEAALEQALCVGGFDIAFYNAGVDVHAEDRLGRLSLSDAGVAARDACVLKRLRAAGLATVGVIGGGYCDDAERIAERHAHLFEQAARVSDATPG